MSGLREELGDLLFQVLFHAEMASEDINGFDLDEVSDALVRKMVDRHPHVFNSADSADPPKLSWEALKAKERKSKGHNSLLDDVALALPALMRAEKLQKRAARVGFDWPNLDGVFAKITEETQDCLLYTSPSPRDATLSRMPSSA